MGKQKTLIVTALFFLVLGAATGAYYFFYKTGNVAQQSDCLTDDETASYEIKERKRVLGDVIADVTVNVTNKQTNLAVNTFQIKDVFKNYHPIEIHLCGVYLIKFLNYDPQKTKQNPGFKAELWGYRYNGQGNTLLILSEKDQQGVFKGNYSYDFRIDPDEKYITLDKLIVEESEKGYSGGEDNYLTIKDIKTKEDIFSLSMKGITKQHPNVVGSFGFDTWTKDSRYFWGDIFDGAYVLAYFRIDVTNWKADIFEAPDGAMGGMPLNVNIGYVPIQPGLVWTGDAELTQELKEKENKEGKGSSLYLYNLFTKEKILVETTNEPQFFFKPKWLSDTELQYTLPSGEVKVFTIPK